MSGRAGLGPVTLTQGEAAVEPQLLPHALMRIAGAPIRWLESLRCPQTAALVDEILSTEHRLRETGSAICDLLFARIAGNQDREERRRLLELRRDVHNLRRPDSDKLAAVAASLGEESGRRLREWERRCRFRCELHARAREVLARELGACRGELTRLQHDERLQKGVLAASPVAFDALQEYFAGGSRKLPQKHRRIEETLLSYLSRMTVKTTPLATFAGVARVRWRSEPGALRAVVGDESTAVQIYTGILMELEGRLAAHPDVRPHARFRLNPTLRRHDDGWSVLGVGERPSEDVRLLRNNTERLILVKPNPVVEALREELPGAEALSGPELLGRLGRRLGIETRDLARYLDRLAGLGVVRSDLAIPDQEPCRLTALQERLREIPTPLARDTAADLGLLAGDLAAYGSAGSGERRRLVERILERIQKLLNRVGARADREFLERWAVVEDLRIQLLDERLPDGLGQTVAGDLGNWAAVSALFDVTLMQKLASAAFFRAHYRPDDRVGAVEFFTGYFQAFRNALPELVSEREGLRPENPWRVFGIDAFRSPELDELLGLQAAFLELVRSAADADGDQVVRLDPERLGEFVAALPHRYRTAATASFLGQMGRGEDGHPVFVINEHLSGPGKFLSRFSRLLDDGGDAPALGTALRAAYAGLMAPDQRLAEVGGVFGYSGNLHAPLTDWEIEYPAAVPRPPEDRLIPLGDLAVRFDAEHQRIRFVSLSSGHEVVPLDLGYLYYPAQPPFYQFLCQNSWAQGIPTSPLHGFLETYGRGRRTLPRVELGRIVLQRRQSLIPRDELPWPSAGEDAIGFAVRVRRWHEQLGLAPTCFVRLRSRAEVYRLLQGSVAPTNLRGSHESPAAWALPAKLRKAQYMDFTSPLLLRMFRRLLEHVGDHLVVEEMLPAAEDAFIEDSTGDRFVSEVLLEFRLTGSGLPRDDDRPRPGTDHNP